jgi:hypothetical protein
LNLQNPLLQLIHIDLDSCQSWTRGLIFLFWCWCFFLRFFLKPNWQYIG